MATHENTIYGLGVIVTTAMFMRTGARVVYEIDAMTHECTWMFLTVITLKEICAQLIPIGLVLYVDSDQVWREERGIVDGSDGGFCILG